MRVHVAAGLTAAMVLVASTGCSTLKMPSLPTFGKSKTKAADASKLTNAPPAPQLNGVAGAAPAVSMPNPASTAQSWNSMPVYPGTTYPQTPHPEPAVAMAQPAYAAPAAAAPGVATGTPTSPYGAYPTTVAQAPPAYAPPAAPAYAQPQQGAYGAAAPYGQAAQQTPAPGYAQQGAPYSAPPNPYTSPAPPQNAANPYGNVTR